jgi:hypothetical protein
LRSDQTAEGSQSGFWLTEFVFASITLEIATGKFLSHQQQDWGGAAGSRLITNWALSVKG